MLCIYTELNFFDLFNFIKGNIFDGLSNLEMNVIVAHFLAILCLIELDQIALDIINCRKHQLELIKQKDMETIKRLSKIIK